MEINVAAVQTRPVLFDFEGNLRGLISACRALDADLIVAPELALSGYVFKNKREVEKAAVNPAASPQFDAIINEVARPGRRAVVVGFAERADDGEIYNSAALLTPNGLAGVYRKVHLFADEKDFFAPGNRFDAFEINPRQTPFRVGMMICFDWLFPEAARTLALKGADIIAHPSNLVLPHCQSVMPARALENRVFTITANRVGTETNENKSLSFTGGSVICSPGGETLASASKSDPDAISARADLSRCRNKRITPRNDALGDRRPDAYELCRNFAE